MPTVTSTFVRAAAVVFVEPRHAGPRGRGDGGLEGGRLFRVPQVGQHVLQLGAVGPWGRGVDRQSVRANHQMGMQKSSQESRTQPVPISSTRAQQKQSRERKKEKKGGRKKES